MVLTTTQSYRWQPENAYAELFPGAVIPEFEAWL